MYAYIQLGIPFFPVIFRPKCRHSAFFCIQRVSILDKIITHKCVHILTDTTVLNIKLYCFILSLSFARCLFLKDPINIFIWWISISLRHRSEWIEYEWFMLEFSQFHTHETNQNTHSHICACKCVGEFKCIAVWTPFISNYHILPLSSSSSSSLSSSLLLLKLHIVLQQLSVLNWEWTLCKLYAHHLQVAPHIECEPLLARDALHPVKIYVRSKRYWMWLLCVCVCVWCQCPGVSFIIF